MQCKAKSQGARVKEKDSRIMLEPWTQEPRKQSQADLARAKYPCAQSQEPRATQGPRAKEQEPKTKRQRPRVIRTGSQGPCKSYAME